MVSVADVDGVPDLHVVHRRGGSGSTEMHVVDGRRASGSGARTPAPPGLAHWRYAVG